MNIQPQNSYQQLFNLLAGNQSAVPSDERAEERSLARADSTARLAQDDQVSLSLRSSKLQKISADFFSGIIKSSQIPALTQRLYEEGFLDDKDYRLLGGQTQKVSVISEANSFINRSLMSAIEDGKQDEALELAKVSTALAEIDLKSTAERRQVEKQALAYIQTKLQSLQQEGAPSNLLKGFQNVADVLAALEKVRQQESSTGALASYSQVQDAYDEFINRS